MKESNTIARQIQQLKIYLNNLVSEFNRGELETIELREEVISQRKEILDLKLQVISIFQEIEKDKNIIMNDCNIHSNCPICDTDIQDTSLKECGKCNWVFIEESSLSRKTYDSLIDWSIRRYTQVQELESRGNYAQLIVKNRLDKQRDTISVLEIKIENILQYLKPEQINSYQDFSTEPFADIDCEINHNPCYQAEQESEEDYIISELSVDLQSFSSILEDSIIESNVLLNYSPTSSAIIDFKSLEDIIIDSNMPDSPSYSISPERSAIEITAEEIDLDLNIKLPAEPEIISDYYHKPREFAAKYQTKIASITKNYISSNRGSEDKIVILEEASRGNYWIFSFANCNYLVPVEDKYINQHSYTTTSTIFEGHNYTPDYKKIQLVKPAIVSIDPNTNPQTWRLQEQGEIVFL